MKNKMRANIIKHSAKLFLVKGYTSSSMSDIAFACGIQKGSIYHHFDGKEKLLNSVIEELEETFRTNMFGIAYDEKISRPKRLSIMLNFIEEYISERNGCLMTRVALEIKHTLPKTHHRIVKFYQNWISSFKHIYMNYYDDKHAADISEDLVVKLEGSFIWINIDHNFSPLNRICAQAKYELSTTNIFHYTLPLQLPTH